MRKILGVLILLLVFAALFAIVALKRGLLVAIIAFGAAFAVAGLLVLACYLITF